MIGTMLRFGGELPLGCDVLREKPADFPNYIYPFFSGRSAIAWFAVARGPFKSAAVCAYTCPIVPQVLRQAGIDVRFFDVEEDVARVAKVLPAPFLIVVPALFGCMPWIDTSSLAKETEGRGVILVDAAQTAFGALDMDVPANGAVLCCPRKTLAVGDGALLAVSNATERELAFVRALDTDEKAAQDKQSARAIFASNSTDDEITALALNHAAETSLQAVPKRMTQASWDIIRRVDQDTHRSARRANAAKLLQRLEKTVECVLTKSSIEAPAVPSHFPINCSDRDGVLQRLKSRRVFATPLWTDTEHDPERHPSAARMAKSLIALPVDQRYGSEIGRAHV